MNEHFYSHPGNVSSSEREQNADFKRLARVKRTERAPAAALGDDLVRFFKKSVQRPQQKLGVIGDAWRNLIPSTLLEHTALDAFFKGNLTVLVDSSSHLYELRTLLLSGLHQQLLIACKSSGLRKITLKHGRWYRGDGPDMRIQFQ
jgi:hypothetical protein